MPIDYSAAALAAARQHCGWPVTPPVTDDVATVDGGGGRVLSLPTLHLTAVSEVVEDGVELDLAGIRWNSRGELRKRNGMPWLGDVEVTFSHGYASAPDFDAAVEQAAKALSAHAARKDPALTAMKVDDVEKQWSVTLLAADALLNKTLLGPYRILPSP